jgi:hypothetical protein
MRTSRRILSRAALLATLLIVVFAVAAGAAATIILDHHVVNTDGTATYFYTVTWTEGTAAVDKVAFLLGNCYAGQTPPAVSVAGTWTAATPNVCTPSSDPPVRLLCGSTRPACDVEFLDNIGPPPEPTSVANYCFTVNIGNNIPVGAGAVSLIVGNVGGGQTTSTVDGPTCTPTAVTLAEMRATAMGAPLAALGALALTGLAAFAALRRRVA